MFGGAFSAGYASCVAGQLQGAAESSGSGQYMLYGMQGMSSDVRRCGAGYASWLLAAGAAQRCSNEYAAVCRAVMFRRRSVLVCFCVATGKEPLKRGAQAVNNDVRYAGHEQ
jgi:hypothetical protein